jgi:hypothetical protein
MRMSTRFGLIGVVWLVAIGCGDGGQSGPPDGDTGDGGSDAAAGVSGAARDGGSDSASGAGGSGGLGGAGATACGFIMPNPASAGLPNPASYSANQDGTITDNVTGLVWEGTPASDSYDLDGATAHCAGKAGGWRLPTRLELVSLVDFTIAPPGPTINSIFANTPADSFWSSSVDASGSQGVYAWGVHFGFGYTSSSFSSATGGARARCVRSPALKCYATRHQVSDGLVHDQTTGLTWQQAFEPASQNDAKTLCANLGTGWRLPSLTELQTIVDDTKSVPPTIDIDAFPNTPGGLNDLTTFWTSSPSTRFEGRAWYVDFHLGFSSDTFFVGAPSQARCVR